MADFAARAETELRLDDTYLEANLNNQLAVIDVVERTPVEAFVNAHLTVPASGANGRFNPRYVSIDNSRTAGEQGDDATRAWINRSLQNTNAGRQVRQLYLCGMLHPQSLRQIYPYLTTARGISIYS